MSDMYTSVTTRSANAYKRVAIDTSVSTASSHHMVTLLFDELLLSLASARHALKAGDISGKVRHVGKAMRILQEGLLATLDMERGGLLASQLKSLYEYCGVRLVSANARNDMAGLQEVTDLIAPIAESWKQIGGAGHVANAA